MEQRLDATFLRPSLAERGAAIALGATGAGLAILLAAWGVSLLWRYTPPEIAVRIANPELRLKQETPLKVQQDKPFVLSQPAPLKIDPGQLNITIDRPPAPFIGDRETVTKTINGDIIRREVTVFSEVKHEPGRVTTGWNYKDGSGGVPIHQYCYYTASDGRGASMKVDIALDGSRLFSTATSLVPDIKAALAKCQWWRN
jgi:hypothetical protein